MSEKKSTGKLLNTMELACLEFALSVNIDDEIRKIDFDKIDKICIH